MLFIFNMYNFTLWIINVYLHPIWNIYSKLQYINKLKSEAYSKFKTIVCFIKLKQLILLKK